MFLGFPYCSFKCERECGCPGICQNSPLARAPIIEVDIDRIVARYMDNPISGAIVCGGLEPLDSWSELLAFVTAVRQQTTDPIVIYTGYYADEITEQLDTLKTFENIIVKFGRFIPNQQSRYDEVLGVTLVSNNQYAVYLGKSTNGGTNGD